MTADKYEQKKNKNGGSYGDKNKYSRDGGGKNFRNARADKKPWSKDKKPYDKIGEASVETEKPQKPLKKVMLRQDLIAAAQSDGEKSTQKTQKTQKTQETQSTDSSQKAGIEKNILYEDNHVLVVVKPQNLPTQGDKTGDKCLLDELKEYLIKKYDKPGDAYLGLVHRLDRPTGGVMVFAKTSKAAARLSEQIREGDFDKCYAAVTAGKPNRFGRVEHYLFKDERNNYVSLVPSSLEGAKLAVSEVMLVDETRDDEERAETVEATEKTEKAEAPDVTAPTEAGEPSEKEEKGEKTEKAETIDRQAQKREKLSLVSVKLLTGRTHQVRVQLKALGAPIVGDGKYAGDKLVRSPHLALWAYKLCFTHPVSGDLMLFYSQPPQEFPWTEFDTEGLVDTLRPRK